LPFPGDRFPESGPGFFSLPTGPAFVFVIDHGFFAFGDRGVEVHTFFRVLFPS
jgi:hypothetical protein